MGEVEGAWRSEAILWEFVLSLPGAFLGLNFSHQCFYPVSHLAGPYNAL